MISKRSKVSPQNDKTPVEGSTLEHADLVNANDPVCVAEVEVDVVAPFRLALPAVKALAEVIPVVSHVSELERRGIGDPKAVAQRLALGCCSDRPAPSMLLRCSLGR